MVGLSRVKHMKWQQIVSHCGRLGWYRIKHRVQSMAARWLLWRWGAQVGAGLFVNGRLRCWNRHTLRIGRNVRLNSGGDLNYAGGDRQTAFYVGPRGKLLLEDGVGISGSTLVAYNSVTLRRGAWIGGGCDIYDTDFHEIEMLDRVQRRGNVRTAPVEIGENAWVGGHSIILKGVKIGRGAVVAAGSLVVKDIGAFELWGGRPARSIRKLDEPTESPPLAGGS